MHVKKVTKTLLSAREKYKKMQGYIYIYIYIYITYIYFEERTTTR